MISATNSTGCFAIETIAWSFTTTFLPSSLSMSDFACSAKLPKNSAFGLAMIPPTQNRRIT
jgi:hypothetical protein